MYEYSAEVIRVVDGDTMHLAVDLGLDVQVKLTGRLEGLNCPEKNTVAGRDAAAFTVEWVSRCAVSGRVTIRTFKDRREKYGRYLVTVLPGPGFVGARTSLNEALLAAGYAVEYP